MTTTTAAPPRSYVSRNEHMTFRANTGVGRHGWLRLTPAYGVRLVRDRIAELDPGAVVADPFSGTGTTPLAAAELGYRGQALDINPFLVWLGNAKSARYGEDSLRTAAREADRIAGIVSNDRDAGSLWEPPLFKIEKWWSPTTLNALKVLRAELDSLTGQVRDLLDVAFCRTLISCSNAAFNHQSMSFKDEADMPRLFELDEAVTLASAFGDDARFVIASAGLDLSGSARVALGDARLSPSPLAKADLILTSPPYVNRMSYIRELRHYMYWLRFLGSGADAGDLDWQAIGGTWGTATSKLNKWEPADATPVDGELAPVADAIRRDGGRNGSLLATYVTKYHHDMWAHFQSITQQLNSGGRVSYIVGNSTFYGHEVPAQRWYAAMLGELGYERVRVDVIRKRNSNKALFEYEVSGRRP
ncbi:MAG: site-specific DNA-methyltransferase [Propionibacteriaceae bacterium]|jgi:hypothetical protein|nr:site-specific DNA-methyltransferase [Propionibacteriaceae bacterium]